MVLTFEGIFSHANQWFQCSSTVGLKNCRYHETLSRHQWSPEDEPLWLWWSPDIYSNATMRSTLMCVFTEMYHLEVWQHCDVHNNNYDLKKWDWYPVNNICVDLIWKISSCSVSSIFCQCTWDSNCSFFPPPCFRILW